MFPLADHGGLFEPLLILVTALIIDAVLGDPPWLWRRVPHPVALLGKLIDFLDRKLNRPNRPGYDRRVRGALVAAGLTLGAVGLGWAVSEFRRASPFGALLELALTWALIAQRSLYDHVRTVATALEKGGLPAGRRAVSMIVGRDPDSLDEAGVARAAIESCAENFSDAVVAPVFWFVLFGLPGLMAYKTVNTLDSMIGHRSEQYLEFGMVSARLDDAMNLIPARFAGLLIALASAFVPGGNPLRGWRVMLRDHGHHRSPNSGWPESAMAGSLGLALGGPRRYPGYVADEKWLGEGGRQKAELADIHAALYVMAVACLLNGGAVLLAILVG
ncbi:MAG TPA: adenosylcobinamide-phosphate synthase CbiB [Candidatus Sulfotelmatobacter sp.]|jgi:adenosylcobinamide-phosphate synthase|nr:adenosylcobinamide-phosphate synthase CbiB [Candidatus Sulfotelmatobacter sp.]